MVKIGALIGAFFVTVGTVLQIAVFLAVVNGTKTWMDFQTAASIAGGETEFMVVSSIIVFSGAEIEQDVKAQLISSGIGVEVEWSEEDGFGLGLDIFRQRVLIELGLDWLNDQKNRKV